jgi:hypothetical protein
MSPPSAIYGGEISDEFAKQLIWGTPWQLQIVGKSLMNPHASDCMSAAPHDYAVSGSSKEPRDVRLPRCQGTAWWRLLIVCCPPTQRTDTTGTRQPQSEPDAQTHQARQQGSPVRSCHQRAGPRKLQSQSACSAVACDSSDVNVQTARCGSAHASDGRRRRGVDCGRQREVEDCLPAAARHVPHSVEGPRGIGLVRIRSNSSFTRRGS